MAHNNSNRSVGSKWEERWEGLEGALPRNKAANGCRNVLDEARALLAADSCASAV